MIERYYEQQRQNWLHVGSMGVYMAVARALDSLASTYTHVLVQEEKGALDSIASPAGRPTPSATPPDREEEGSGKTARQPHQKDSTISDVGPRGSRHRNNTRGSQRSSRAGVSRHHCTGALGQQCLFHDVCLTESDDTLRLTYFTPSFPPGNGDAVNGDAGGCPGPGGDISKLRIPLGRRPDDCGYMEIDAAEVHKHGPRADDGGTDGELLDVRFDDTNTVLIESTVPENAGHTLGEDVFCAFDMLALADAMLPEIVREARRCCVRAHECCSTFLGTSTIRVRSSVQVRAEEERATHRRSLRERDRSENSRPNSLPFRRWRCRVHLGALSKVEVAPAFIGSLWDPAGVPMLLTSFRARWWGCEFERLRCMGCYSSVRATISTTT